MKGLFSDDKVMREGKGRMSCLPGSRSNINNTRRENSMISYYCNWSY